MTNNVMVSRELLERLVPHETDKGWTVWHSASAYEAAKELRAILDAPASPIQGTASHSVPAGLYRELVALRELRNAIVLYRDKYMLDEIYDEECCIDEKQHECAVSVHKLLESSISVKYSQDDNANQ